MSQRLPQVVVGAVDAGQLPDGTGRNPVAAAALEALLRSALWRDPAATGGLVGRVVRRSEVEAAAAAAAAAAGRAPGDADVAAALATLVRAVEEGDVATARRGAAALGGDADKIMGALAAMTPVTY